jgi:hypothetical protein
MPDAFEPIILGNTESLRTALAMAPMTRNRVGANDAATH